jgi:hypothetical protein
LSAGGCLSITLPSLFPSTCSAHFAPTPRSLSRRVAPFPPARVRKSRIGIMRAVVALPLMLRTSLFFS